MTAPDGRDPGAVTAALQRWSRGDAAALDALLPVVYDELRVLARRQLRRERAGHTLQPTALVHEAYLRLAGGSPPAWRNRVHFLAAAARVMRQVLVDHARSCRAAKRGGGALTVSLDESPEPAASTGLAVTALDEALDRLAELDPRQARLVELRFFGGLTLEETAALAEVSVPVVVREVRAARAWLYRQLVG